MDSDELILVTASMMHDIGKVRQRYDYSKNHQDHGYDMVQSIPTFPYLDIIAKLVKYHHTDPESTDLDGNYNGILAVLEESDRLSAAHDRQDRDETQKTTKKLQKVYSLVMKDNRHSGGQVEGSQGLVDSERIGGGIEHFPIITLGKFLQNPLNLREGWEDASYRGIESTLIADLRKIRYHDDDRIGYLDMLLSAIEMDLAFVPSAYYYSFGDISLYHHLKLTAAIALSKYRNAKANTNGFMVIGCNLSGIQKYIFRHYVSEAADDRATRRLKGRSFLVSLFTDAIITYMLRRLDLPRANVIYEKSDGFAILCNYSPETERIVKLARANIERFAIGWGRGLVPSIAYIRIDEDDLDPDKYSDERSFGLIVDRLNSAINRRKYSIMNDNPRSLFEIQASPRDTEWNLCDFCGLEYGPYADGSGRHKCKRCEDEEKLGSKAVKEHRFSMVFKEGSSDGNADMTFDFWDASVSYYFGRSGDETIVMNPSSFEYQESEGAWRPMLIGNFVPKDSRQDVKTLEELLKCKDERSFRRCLNLGLLKMDMDSMGTILTARFKRSTISVFSSFMFYTALFYASIVNEIASSEKCETYIVYSGGDDLTAFSSATSIVEFTNSLHEKFNEYFAYDSVTVSAGIGAFEPKFPIRRAVEIAEDCLKESKGQPTKDSITVFGNTMRWDEFARSKRVSEDIILKNIKDNKIHNFFPYFLLELDERNIYTFSRLSKDRIVFVPDPYISYYISRNYSDKDSVGAMISKLIDHEVIKNLRFIAYYAVLKEREEGMQESGDNEDQKPNDQEVVG